MVIGDSLLVCVLLGFLFWIGACIGSFLNLVSVRIPNRVSIVIPRSYCPNCGTTIPWKFLMPVIGFALTHGHCHHCQKSIPVRYIIVEILTGLLTMLLFLRFFSTGDLFPGDSSLATYAAYLPRPFFSMASANLAISLWLLYTGIPLALIDLRHRILPDTITLPGIPVGFMLGALHPTLRWEGSLLGIAAGGGGLYLISFLYKMIRGKEGMGMGDIKYLCFIGAVLGWQGVFSTLFLASCSGAVFGIVRALYRGEGLNHSLPFGPFLATSALFISVFPEFLSSSLPLFPFLGSP